MWMILGATVGLAALVDRHKASAIDARLGEPITLAEGIKIKLPANWDDGDTTDDELLASLVDPRFGRAIEVELKRIGLSDVFSFVSPARSGASYEKIKVGNADGHFRYIQRRSSRGPYGELVASRVISAGQTLVITLTVFGDLNPAELKRERSLIERVAASVELPESMNAAPATQP